MTLFDRKRAIGINGWHAYPFVSDNTNDTLQAFPTGLARATDVTAEIHPHCRTRLHRPFFQSRARQSTGTRHSRWRLRRKMRPLCAFKNWLRGNQHSDERFGGTRSWRAGRARGRRNCRENHVELAPIPCARPLAALTRGQGRPDGAAAEMPCKSRNRVHNLRMLVMLPSELDRGAANSLCVRTAWK